MGDRGEVLPRLIVVVVVAVVVVTVVVMFIVGRDGYGYWGSYGG